MGEQTALPGLTGGDGPDDMISLDEAAKLVDRSRHTIRWWARIGQLRSVLVGSGNQQKRLVSRAGLLALVVQAGKAAHPGGPGRGEDPGEVRPGSPPDPSLPPQAPDLRLDLATSRGEAAALRAEVAGLRGELAALRVALDESRARIAAVEHAGEERAAVERLRAAEWKDRAEALTAEVVALRGAAGLPWWRRLLG